MCSFQCVLLVDSNCIDVLVCFCMSFLFFVFLVLMITAIVHIIKFQCFKDFSEVAHFPVFIFEKLKLI